jgi:hypothetical protein
MVVMKLLWLKGQWSEKKRKIIKKKKAGGKMIFLSTLHIIFLVLDTTKRLMSSPKCRSVEVINNPARPGSNHREVYCINYS